MLLLQNLALVAQSMGLGGWIHAAFETSILLGGYPEMGPGLGFRFERPKKRLRLPRPYPAGTPNPVGLDGVLQSYAPPYFKDTDVLSTPSLPKSTDRQASIATAPAPRRG
jgi:hypothetical protein